MFDSNNPIVKIALNQFLKGARKEGVRHILVSIPPEGDPSFTTYKEPVKVFTETDYTTIKNYIDNGNSANENKPGNDNSLPDSTSAGQGGSTEITQ